MARAQEAILLTLGSLPDHRVEGKKKLQKLVHLLKLSGAEISADFQVLLYGPFSKEIADAAEFLVLTGKIDRKLEPIGIYDTYKSVYSLPNQAIGQIHKWPERVTTLLNKLNTYTTIELEVASTIGYFRSLRLSEQAAIERTRAMKPTKSVRPVLKKAMEILQLVDRSSLVASK
jgi:uncharacterized protein YwgA